MYDAAFIGRSELGPVNKPEALQRWGQFLVKFGGFIKSGYLAHSVNGFFENMGTKCYVVNLKEETDEGYLEALKALEGLDIAFLAAPGCTSQTVHTAIARFCEDKNCIGILDLPLETGKKGIAELERLVNSERCLYYYPWIYVWDFKRGEDYVPPSGHMAGVHSYSARRQKNPEVVLKIKGLRYVFTAEDEELLASKGINVVRQKIDIVPPEEPYGSDSR